MKKEKFNELSIDTLQQRLSVEEEALMKLKMAHGITPVENPMRIREARKVIARIKTAIRQKELAN